MQPSGAIELVACKTFTPFVRLPIELRAKVWNLAAHPRIIEVTQADRLGPLRYIRASCHAPALMQSCTEARRNAPYVKAFTNGSQPRYTWINFDSDMIHIPGASWDDAAWQPHRGDIKRLKFAYEYVQSGESFFHFRYRELDLFTALQEIWIYPLDSTPWIWAETYESAKFPRWVLENVRFICNRTGMLLNGRELCMADHWHLWQSWDQMGRASGDSLEEQIYEQTSSCNTLQDMHDDGLASFAA